MMKENKTTCPELTGELYFTPCTETKPLFESVKFDPKTGKVYDESGQYIGKGRFIDDRLEISLDWDPDHGTLKLD